MSIKDQARALIDQAAAHSDTALQEVFRGCMARGMMDELLYMSQRYFGRFSAEDQKELLGVQRIAASRQQTQLMSFKDKVQFMAENYPEYYMPMMIAEMTAGLFNRAQYMVSQHPELMGDRVEFYDSMITDGREVKERFPDLFIDEPDDVDEPAPVVLVMPLASMMPESHSIH